MRVGDDLDAEDVGETRATVAAEGPEDQVLPLLIEDQDPREHGGCCGLLPGVQELDGGICGGIFIDTACADGFIGHSTSTCMGLSQMFQY